MRLLDDSIFGKLLEASAFEWIGLILALGVLGWAIFRIRAWYREDEDPETSQRQLLAQSQEMFRQGHLTEEEFRSIKRRLFEQQDRR